MATRGSVNSPNCFCYICGSYTVKKQQRNISNFVQKVYFAYFGIKLGDQDKSWAPHVVCSVCVEELRHWFQGKKKSFRFAVPMIWREPKNHSDDCYFCSCSVQGFNLKNRKDISYPTIIRSAIRPVTNGYDLPIPSPPDTLDNILDNLDQISHISSDNDDGYDPGTNDPELFSQSDLNDLVLDLGLPKDTAEVLEGDLVFCNNVPAILEIFKITYEPEDWRLFIDSSKKSLKAVLPHNGNRYASVSIVHSVHLKECYENLEFILNKLSSDHKWTICGDLKVISMLLGQQSGYTKFPCFLCEWDSRDRKQHYVKQTWPIRKALISGVKNVERQSLVDPKKILFPPLHIKFELMKQFVKALDKEGECFKYLCEQFPSLSDAKLKEGIFVGPDIRKLLKDETFVTEMEMKEKNAGNSFKLVVTGFLGNKKDPNYKALFAELLQNYKILGCNMSVKVHFLHSHLDYFSEKENEFGKVEPETVDLSWFSPETGQARRLQRRKIIFGESKEVIQ
ncbi:uncharacterized protein TNCV_353581 [Trichonephila clavipes]|nr:uncharacterized protein TNCV_353581 [Trichonephila clavipes]